MDKLLQKVLGGQPANPSPSPKVDSDFADFAGAPDPSPVSGVPPSLSASSVLSESATPTAGSLFFQDGSPRPYTKWYRVWERVTVRDFTTEFLLLPFILLVTLVHLWGSRTNKRKARSWITAHGPILEQEYALVGFRPHGTKMVSENTLDPMELLKQKSVIEYTSFATGRANVAFTDLKLLLAKRHNPMARIGEEAVGFFMESQPAPIEHMEATSYPFDGREQEIAPILASDNKGPTDDKQQKKEKFNSKYDGFVFAVVHKERMKFLREARYDLSLTSSKDHAKLPEWATVMSEGYEIAEAMLTDQLCKAVEQAGDAFESLIVSDQPIERPATLDEAKARKRVSLSLRFPSDFQTTTPVFEVFLRYVDHLVNVAHFRPEALRRVKATREDEVRKMKRVSENEKQEERRVKSEKEKKEERDKRLRSMPAEEQRKELERERTQDLRKGQKRKAVRA